MRHRTLTSLGALVVGLVWLAPALASGQTSASAAEPTKRWIPPRTPDGQPDLQGVWLNNDATPLERPKALEGKRFLTGEEVAALRKNAARLFRGDLDSDAAGGDNFFLAALANPEVYKNRNATGSGVGADREIDNRTSLIVAPPDGKIPLMTPAGRQRRLAADAATLAVPRPSPPAGPEDLSNFIRCLTYGAPRLGGAAASYHNYYQIVQTPGYVMLLSEAIHDVRIIPLDGRPHLPQTIRLWLGDSRGRWEGNTLIVETTNLLGETAFPNASPNLRLTERFKRVDADTLLYEFVSNFRTS